jgi:predicted RNA-binding Zn-ribbon protein involved in translation (DUF1610 family)
LSSNDVPIECAACGLFLGTGLPGAHYFCSKCESFVIARARGGDLGTALGALALVGLFVLIGAAIVKAFKD